MAALVLLPCIQDHGCGGGSLRAKAAQDLEVIKKAIWLHDAREDAPLRGTSLEPLLGRYMQELPRDPWGRLYLFDGELGVVASLGRDGCPGLTNERAGEDRDVLVRTRPRPDLDDEALLRQLGSRRDLPCEEGWLRGAAVDS